MGGATVLVLNAAARQGEDSAEEVRERLRAHGVRLDGVHLADGPERLAEALAAALATGPARLLVGGGDGTLSSAANHLAGTGVVLGVLPLGTANDFARNLRIPADLDLACAVVAAGHEREVAVGLANGRVFLNALSFGLSSAISRRLTPELKRRAGKLAYPVAAAGEALTPAPFRLTLGTPGAAPRSLDALQVVVGNGRYHGGGTLVAPGATLDDAALDLYAVEAAAPSDEGADRARNALVLARVGLLLLRGRHLEHERVLHLRCREVTLEAAPAQEVDLDGELAGETPLECRVAPGRLRVLAPPTDQPRSAPATRPAT